MKLHLEPKEVDFLQGFVSILAARQPNRGRRRAIQRVARRITERAELKLGDIRLLSIAIGTWMERSQRPEKEDYRHLLQKLSEAANKEMTNGKESVDSSDSRQLEGQGVATEEPSSGSVSE